MQRMLKYHNSKLMESIGWAETLSYYHGKWQKKWTVQPHRCCFSSSCRRFALLAFIIETVDLRQGSWHWSMNFLDGCNWLRLSQNNHPQSVSPFPWIAWLYWWCYYAFPRLMFTVSGVLVEQRSQLKNCWYGLQQTIEIFLPLLVN